MSFKAKNRLKVYSPDKIKSILERKLKSPTGYYNVTLFKREDVDISVPTYGVEDTISMVKGFLNGRWGTLCFEISEFHCIIDLLNTDYRVVIISREY